MHYIAVYEILCFKEEYDRVIYIFIYSIKFEIRVYSIKIS